MLEQTVSNNSGTNPKILRFLILKPLLELAKELITESEDCDIVFHQIRLRMSNPNTALSLRSLHLTPVCNTSNFNSMHRSSGIFWCFSTKPNIPINTLKPRSLPFLLLPKRGIHPFSGSPPVGFSQCPLYFQTFLLLCSCLQEEKKKIPTGSSCFQITIYFLLLLEFL